MDIDLVFKIAAIGIVVAVLNQLLVRSDRPDQAMLVSLAGLITTCVRSARSLSSSRACSGFSDGAARQTRGAVFVRERGDGAAEKER